jgi:outer membrane protein OmpA-like peptidoglycan-associated protein
MNKLALAAAGALALASAGTAFAQSPSADDIISSLRATPSQLRGPTRGIRPATIVPDQMSAPDPAVSRVSHVSTRHVQEAQPATSATAADSADGPSVKLVVDFRTGSADLTPSAEHTLDQLGQALTSPALEKFRFRVEGHTDTVGDPEANKALSAKRAEAVTTYLEQKFAVDASRLEAVGLGSDTLLVPTPPQTPEPRNRRVRIVNLGT